MPLDDGHRRLLVLKALRGQYFWTEKAEQMFGQEESMQQMLLDAGEAMQTQNMTQAQAIKLAQAKLSRQISQAGSTGQGPP